MIEIEAVQFDGDNWEEIQRFTRFQFGTDGRLDDNGIIASVYDRFHDTWVGVNQGDWIIKGTKGEFYPCNDDVFQAKYEEVEE